MNIRHLRLVFALLMFPRLLHSEQVDIPPPTAQAQKETKAPLSDEQISELRSRYC